MKVAVRELEGLKRELSVEIPADTVQQEMDKKYAELRKKVTMKGFRPGKAPLDRIKAEYGDSVRADVVEELIRSTYPEAVRQETLRVAALPTVTHVDFDREGCFQYTAEVEVFPEIEKVDIGGLKAAVDEIEVGDAEVDEFVEVLRKRFSELRDVDRAANESDVVVADLKKVRDPGLVLAGDSFEDQEIDLDAANTVKEFKEHLVGAKPGDSKEIEINYPDDYPDATFAGANVTYGVAVKTVKERILPEFNDAFAKQTGQAETALELRLQIRKEIEARVNDGQSRKVRGQIIDQVCKRNEIPIPEGLLDEYLGKIVEDFKQRYKDVDEKEVRHSYREVGIKTIRWNLLYQRLSQQEKVEVLPEDTEKRIKRFADNYQMSLEQAKEALARSGSVNEIRDSILEEKVLDFLVSRADVVTNKKQT